MGDGNLAAVKYFVENGADIHGKANNGKSALIEAAQKGDLAMVKYLVEKGADILGKDNNGNSPHRFS